MNRLDVHKRAEHPINNASILITGGTGSFGSHFAKHILTHYNPDRVIIFSRDELKQWQMREEEPLFQDPRVRFFLGDVRDKERLKLALRDVHILIHAAALKQVPAAEYNPTECILTNVIGAMNCINAALESNVRQVIALSTDKAVNPINLYGATKLCSDKLFLAGNAYSGRREYPIFSSVRYGNVMGSRGSLLPFWKRLLEKKNGSLPITDMEMTRFWITLDEAVSFVTMALQEQEGAEVFVPKSPSLSIRSLAQAIYPEHPINITGIRPGEKIHEVLISPDDARNTYEYENHYRIMPEFSVHKPERALSTTQKSMGRVDSQFSLTSSNNPLFLTCQEAIRKLVMRSFCSSEGIA